MKALHLFFFYISYGKLAGLSPAARAGPNHSLYSQQRNPGAENRCLRCLPLLGPTVTEAICATGSTVERLVVLIE
jgi:hypothetical protein